MAEDLPSTPTAKAADVIPALREHAGKAADQTVSSGAEAAETVGRAAESAAQVLDTSLPMLAGYVRNAAQYTNDFADQLRDKKAEELLSTAMTWCRQQPLLTLAGATVLGFALARVAKTGVATPAADGEQASGDANGASGSAANGHANGAGNENR
jgi:hypothetical protein